MHAAATRVRGAALLLVLWLIVLLTGVVGSFALAARVEHMQGTALARGLVARNAARAGIEYAIVRVRLQDPALQWRPDGQPHAWGYQDAEVRIRIEDESGKVDLNTAPRSLLASLLVVLQAERPQQLAAAIADWRDSDSLGQPAGAAEDGDYAAAGRPHGAKDAPFEGIAELRQVLGFTPAVFDAIAPHVTVHSGLPWPDSKFASATVLGAMGLGDTAATGRRDSGAAVFGSGTYSVESRARLPDGRQERLRVVLRLGDGPSGGGYRTLRWEEGAGSR